MIFGTVAKKVSLFNLIEILNALCFSVMVLDSELNGSRHSLNLKLLTFFMHAVLGALSKWRQVTTSSVVSVCPSVRPSMWNNSAPTGRIFMTLDI